MRTNGVILPEQSRPSEDGAVPSYLVPENGAAPKRDWMFDKETGDFVWYPKDRLGMPLNNQQAIPQELAPAVPVLPRPAEQFEDGSTYVNPRQ